MLLCPSLPVVLNVCKTELLACLKCRKGRMAIGTEVLTIIFHAKVMLSRPIF